MRIGGIVDISTKDIPGKSSMVIFTVGCTFQCEFCHNKHLLLADAGKDVEIKEILDKVKTNQLVGSVSITGGEPTLQNDLIQLCSEISNIGKYVSVDTNGSKPKIIKKLLPNVNRIALDLKANPLDGSRYKTITKVPLDPSNIIKTYDLINEQEQIDFEIRTTYVENLMEPKDINEIISFLIQKRFRGTFVLQQYQYSEGVGENLKDKFEKPVHSTLLDMLKQYKDSDLTFKIYLRSEVVGYQNIDNLYKNEK